MAIEYYFNNLDPVNFQRLINAILVSKFGEAIRLLPLRGRDGGRDAETPPGAPVFEVKSPVPGSILGLPLDVSKGRYLFQVKHHRTIDVPLNTVRNSVVSEFESEIVDNVLSLSGEDRVNYFFLITNVPCSKEAVTRVDEKRREFVSKGAGLRAEVLWGEHVIAWLDQSPQIWSSFPDLFAGRVVPRLGAIAGDSEPGLPRSVRAALAVQFAREGIIRFQQLRLEEKLTSLFVDLAVSPSPESQRLFYGYRSEVQRVLEPAAAQMAIFAGGEEIYYPSMGSGSGPSCTRLLILDEGQSEQPQPARRVILEGGPGQGKSTMTQMVAQIYRAMLLDRSREYLRFGTPSRARLPVRIELRIYAEWMEQNQGTIEEFIARTLSKDSGNSALSVDDIHKVAQDIPLLLIFDGLDEIGSDESRDTVLTHISECLERLETGMKADVKVILTTRPPAIAGKSNHSCPKQHLA